MEASGFRFEVVCIGWSHPFLGILMWETNYLLQCADSQGLQQIFFILDEKVNIVEPQQQKRFWFMI